MYSHFLSFSDNNMEKFHSGFRARHSMESTVSLDPGRWAILILLDLWYSRPYYSLELSRAPRCMKGSALQWFTFYLIDRSFSVKTGNLFSSSVPITYRVPQGSILVPILFALYMLPSGSICQKYNISYHCYADGLAPNLHAHGRNLGVIINPALKFDK